MKFKQLICKSSISIIIMSYQNLLDNNIFFYQKHNDFEKLNNLTINELRVFINLVTKHGNNSNIHSDYYKFNGGNLLNNIDDCKKLFLLGDGGYSDVQLFFSLNIPDH